MSRQTPVESDLNRLKLAYQRNGINCESSPGTYFNWSEWRDEVEKKKYILFLLNARLMTDNALMRKTCGGTLVAYRITFRVVAVGEQKAGDIFDQALAKIYSPDGVRVGPNRVMPKEFGGVTFYEVEPVIREVDFAARPQPMEPGNFWGVSTEFKLVFNL